MDPLASLSLLFLLSFIGCCAGQDVLPEGPVDAILGTNVTLKTLLDKPNYFLIFWTYNDGKELVQVASIGEQGLVEHERFKGRTSIDDVNGHLTLGPLALEDTGDYTINVVTSGGIPITGETRLRVLEPLSDLIVTSSPMEAVEHNSTVELTCSAKGSALSFTWAPLKADGKRITVKKGDQSSVLTIAGVLRSDAAAPISCTASNQLQRKSIAINVTVHYGPDGASISPSAPPPFISSASNFSLWCSCSSSPAASFSWLSDGVPTGVMAPTLTLEDIQKLGPGGKNLSCSATNAKTQRSAHSATVAFTVVEPISGVSVSGPSEVLVAGVGVANLSCQAAGGAISSVLWLKDGKPVAASPRMHFTANMTALSISALQKEDNGVFTCELSNPVTMQRASYSMTVNYGPESAAVAGQKAVEVKDKVTLSCSAPSIPPANFTWKFNGTATQVRTAEFNIEAAVYKNTGTYTCVAHNAVTGETATSSHLLSVKEEGALDEGLSDGAIAGIVIAVLVALAAAIALIFYCRQKVPVESPY